MRFDDEQPPVRSTARFLAIAIGVLLAWLAFVLFHGTTLESASERQVTRGISAPSD